MAKAKSQKSLSNWTKEEWGTKSGKNSTQGSKATGERYLPKKARAALGDEEYNRSTAKSVLRCVKVSSTVNNLMTSLRKQQGIGHK